MPTIRKIKNKSGIKWRAEISVNGTRESKRFDTKPEASRWALDREVELSNRSELVGGKTIADALDRYAAECIPDTKKGKRWELIRIKKFKRDPIARVPVAELTLEHGREYIARASETLKPNSVIREMNLLKPVVRQCVEWKWIAAYPWDRLKMPKGDKARVKLYTQKEIELIIQHSGLLARKGKITSRNQETGVAFLLACESAMRLGEITALKWSQLSIERRTAFVADSKNGEPRTVPLSTRALEVIDWLPIKGERVFTVNSRTASTLFRRIRTRAGILDGTFHDSRRYGTSKLSKKLELLELARVTGHKDINMLLTYYQKSAEEMALKLD